MKLFRIVLRVPAVLICLGLSGCFMSHSPLTIPAHTAILADHARAKAAMARGELKAAEGFLIGEKYRHRSREVVGLTWGELSYQASQIVLKAHARGEAVNQDALFQSYMVMSYSHDMPVALDYLAQGQRLLDAGNVSEAAYKQAHLVDRRIPILLIYRYLDSGGRIDWSSELQQGYHELYFRSPPPRPGEHDPRDFYRFLEYLTLEDREWLFANFRLNSPLDDAIWRDEAKLRAFSRTLEYFYWYDDNRFEGYLSSAMMHMSNEQHICAARKRGYIVIDSYGVLYPETCGLPQGH